MRPIYGYRRISVFVIFMLSICLFIPTNIVKAQNEEFPQSNAWFEATPSVVWCGDSTSTIVMKVHIVGRSDVQRAWVTNLYSDASMGEREFFDDGSNGDEIAGDRIFTLSLSTNLLPCDSLWLEERGGYGKWNGFIQVELANGEIQSNWYPFVVGLVNPQYRDEFEVQDLGNGLSATKYAFFIEDTNHEVMSDYPVANVYCGTSNFMAYQKFYGVIPDDFDFALVMPGMQLFHPGDYGENTPYTVSVSNSIQNIGMPIFDNTNAFGSDGRLLAVIYHSFADLAVVDHELAHAWGMKIGSSLGTLTTQFGGADNPHWSEYSDIRGQVGAYFVDDQGNVGHFSDNGDETWSLVANTEVEPYSPLELYVMGIIPAEEVPPIHILSDPNLSNVERITAASFRTIPMEEILQASGGVRIPAYPDAARDFNMAFIVTQDVPYNDAAYAYFSLMSHDLMSRNEPHENSYFAPFYWATGGRGTLDTTLPVEALAPDYLPGDPTPTPEPTATTKPTNTSEPVAEVTAEITEETKPASKFPFCGGIIGVLGLALTPTAFRLFRKRRQT